MPAFTHSIPVKPTFATDSQPSSEVRRKDDSLKRLKQEIGGQAWQFDTPTVRRMLSPKRLRSGKDHHLLENYDCDTDREFFKTALRSAQATLTESSKFLRWPNENYPEPKFYPPLVLFLNRCVDACHAALDSTTGAPKRQDRWYRNLSFISYDRETGDGIRSGQPLKPGIVGGCDLKEDPYRSLYWSTPNEDDEQIEMPVEVKAKGSELIAQAASYARCLFRASPSRSFALVLSFDQGDKSLRFLIFHHGGLTATTPLLIEQEDGRNCALELFLAITCWTTATHAGFNPSCNDVEYMVPSDNQGKTGARASATDKLYESVCVRGSSTTVVLLLVELSSTPATPGMSERAPLSKTFTLQRLTATSSTLKPNLPQPWSKLAPAPDAKNNVRRTNNVTPIIPRNRQLSIQYIQPKTFHPSCGIHGLRKELQNPIIFKASWQEDNRKDVEPAMYKASSGLFGTAAHLCSYEGLYTTGEPISNSLFLPTESQLESAFWDIFASGPPTAVDSRTLCYSIFSLEGCSLVEAKSSRELCDALIHCTLGWLSTYQAGYLHRDVSIGNLLLCPTPVEQRHFEITEDFRQTAAKSTQDFTSRLEKLSINGESQELDDTEVQIKRVEQLVKDLDVSNKCKAFITDGNMAAFWATYFESKHGSKKRSGTEEFMSRTLREAMEKNRRYVQSPVDDLHSFYWVALWAVLHNVHNVHRQSTEESSWRQEVEGGFLTRLAASVAIGSLPRAELPTHSPILQHWAPVLRAWSRSIEDLEHDWREAAGQASTTPDVGGDFYLHYFHLFALRGVADFLEMIKGHYRKLCDYEPFS